MPKDKVEEKKKKMQREEEEPLEETKEDEFDKAFDEAMNDKDTQTTADESDDSEEDRDDGSEEDEDKQTTSQLEKDESDQQDDDIFNGTPDNQQDSETDSDDEEEELSTEQKVANLEAELAKEKQRTSSWEGRISAANRRAEEAEAKLKEAQKDKSTAKDGSEDSPAGSEDDSVLSEFIEEFPSLEKPIKVLATKIARDIVKRELGDIKPQINRVQETVQSREAQEHLVKIAQAHPDWQNIYKTGALEKWINNQPKFMQPGLMNVVKEGSAEEVIEMFDAYKRTTGHKKQTTNDGSKTSRDKARKLEAVTHSSPGPPADRKQTAKDDFDGAWDEAVSKE